MRQKLFPRNPTANIPDRDALAYTETLDLGNKGSERSHEYRPEAVAPNPAGSGSRITRPYQHAEIEGTVFVFIGVTQVTPYPLKRITRLANRLHNWRYRIRVRFYTVFHLSEGMPAFSGSPNKHARQPVQKHSTKESIPHFLFYEVAKLRFFAIKRYCFQYIDAFLKELTLWFLHPISLFVTKKRQQTL